MVAPGRTGAAALVDVAGYKNADALVHVVRAFRDPAVPHPAGSVDPGRDAQAMEDELILADLGVVERRLERMDKDLKKNKSAELDRQFRESVQSFRRMSNAEIRAARPLRLKTVTATSADTVERLAARMGVADKQVERFRVLNGLDPTDKLKAGDTVKLIVE